MKCWTVGSELPTVEDEEEQDVEVDLNLPEKPMTNTYQKINVEDFKSFLASKSAKVSKNESSDNTFTCPYSGLTLGGGDQKDLNHQEDKPEFDLPIHIESVEPNPDLCVVQHLDKTAEEDISLQRRTSDGSGLPTRGHSRTGRRKSLSGLMLLDEYRTSIDGATNRLTEDFKSLQQSLKKHRPAQVTFGIGLSRSLSPNAYSFPSLSSLAGLGDNCSALKPVQTSRSCKDLEGLIDTHGVTSPNELLPTETKAKSKLVRSYYSEASKFWQQREQKAIAGQVATNGHHVNECHSPSPSGKAVINGFGQLPLNLKDPLLPDCLTPTSKPNMTLKIRDLHLDNTIDSTDSMSTGTCGSGQKTDAEEIFDMDDMGQ